MTNYSRDPHPRTGALRAQLKSIIHGHSRAEFHVHLYIHELSAVPFLDGDYGVKWKFRGVVNPKGLNSDSKGKERERPSPSWHGSAGHLWSEVERVPQAGPSRMGGLLFNSPPSASPTHSTISLPSSASSSGPSHAAGSSSSHSYPTASMDSEPEPEPSSPRKRHFHSHDKGITPFTPLRDHTIKFEHAIDVVLQMYIDHTTQPASPEGTGKESSSKTGIRSGKATPKGKLLPSPLKLVITQKPTPEDPDANTQPRLGAVYLDLAEYADPSLGPVTRKYLLAESRTNAILKLTIQITPVSVPETGFVAPTLQPATIQSPLLNLLKQRPNVELRSPTPRSATSRAASPTSPNRDPHRISSLLSKDIEARDVIEAIFNPVPTNNPTFSPFTYYVAAPNESDAVTPTNVLPESVLRYARSDGSMNFPGVTASGGRKPATRGGSVKSKSSLSNELVLTEDVTPIEGGPGLGQAPPRRSMSSPNPRPSAPNSPKKKPFQLPHLHQRPSELHTPPLTDSPTAQPSQSPPPSVKSPAQASFSSQRSESTTAGKDKHWWKRIGNGGLGAPKKSESPVPLP